MIRIRKLNQFVVRRIKSLIYFTITFFQISSRSKKFFNVKVPPREKQPFIPTTAVVSCLYERKQPVFIDTDTLEKSGVNLGGLNSQLCKFSDPKFRNLLDITRIHVTGNLA